MAEPQLFMPGQLNPDYDALNLVALGGNKGAVVGALTEGANRINRSGGGKGTIYIPAGTWVVERDYTVPSYVNLQFEYGAILSVASGKTLTISGTFTMVSNSQIFAGSGTVTLSNAPVNGVRPEWWGAKGDGTTNDYTAVQAALTAVAGTYGTVMLGPKTYLVNTGLTVTKWVSVKGAGSNATTLKAGAAMTTLLSFPEVNASGGENSYGVCEGMYLNGNSNADYCIFIETATERTFRNLQLQNAKKCGMVLNNTQNSNFERIIIARCNTSADANGGGLRFNHSASGNVFTGLEMTGNTTQNFVMCQSDSIDPANTAAFPPSGVPSGNIFVGGAWENNIGATMTRNIYMRAGYYNNFFGIGLGLTATNVLDLSNTDGNCYENRWYSCNSVTGTQTSWCKTRGANYNVFDSCAIEGTSTTVFDCDDTASSVVLNGYNHFGTYTNFFSTTGSYKRDQLITGGKLATEGGHLTPMIDYGSAPTVSNVNAGINGTPTVTGNDIRGKLNFTTNGSAPGAGAVLCTLTFAYAYTGFIAILVTGTDAHSYYATTASGAAFNIGTVDALSNTTSYSVYYFVL